MKIISLKIGLSLSLYINKKDIVKSTANVVIINVKIEKVLDLIIRFIL